MQGLVLAVLDTKAGGIPLARTSTLHPSTRNRAGAGEPVRDWEHRHRIRSRVRSSVAPTCGPAHVPTYRVRSAATVASLRVRGQRRRLSEIWRF
jgi:hypothetical protein